MQEDAPDRFIGWQEVHKLVLEKRETRDTALRRKKTIPREKRRKRKKGTARKGTKESQTSPRKMNSEVWNNLNINPPMRYNSTSFSNSKGFG